MRNINTMNSFLIEGFKIERNGEIITLTHEEMSDFRYLDKAIDGKRTLEYFMDECEDEREQDIASKLTEDVDVCFDIEDEYLDIVHSDTGTIEREIVEQFINAYVERMNISNEKE